MLLFAGIGRLFFRVFFVLLLIVLLLQLPLKGKSIMDHYLDEIDNPQIQAVGGWINKIKGKLHSSKATKHIPAVLEVRSPESKKPRSKISLKSELEQMKKPVPPKKNPRLVETRIPKKLSSPILPNEVYTAEEQEQLKEILRGD